MSNTEFEAQFQELRNYLIPMAYRLTNNYEDARDLVQETAIRAFDNCHKYENGTNFKAWVVTIMRNTFINYYRKKKSRATSLEPTGSFVFEGRTNSSQNQGDSNLMMNELMGMINSLSDTYSVPFNLFYKGWKYEEIANHLDLPIGTVKSRIFFARHSLRDRISARYPQGIRA